MKILRNLHPVHVCDDLIRVRIEIKARPQTITSSVVDRVLKLSYREGKYSFYNIT